MTSHIHEPSRWRIAHLSGLCDCFVGCTNGSQQQDEDDDPACITMLRPASQKRSALRCLGYDTDFEGTPHLWRLDPQPAS